ncbi:discoidin domain-containing protein [Vibrio sp. B1FIG11]|nr:discoidin domain-containing protein [Vibrio sp. B1FIG11]
MAIDGDLFTKWTAKGQGIQYLIELSATSTVTKLLYSQAKGDVRQYLFDVEVSNNGINFELVTQVLTPGNTTGFVEQQIGKAGVNFIRLTCNGNNGSDPKLVLWNNFQEIKVLGYTA